MPITLNAHDLLKYDAKHKVLICQECKYAVQKSALGSHLLRHKIYRGERQRLLSSIAQIELLEADDVQLPMSGFPPVEGLPIISGFRCTAVGCQSLWASEKRMRRHWSESHGVSEPHDSFAREVKLQTFFRGTKLKYFEVTPLGAITGKISTTSNERLAQSPGVDVVGSLEPCRRPPCEVELDTLSYFHHFITTTSLMLPFRDSDFAENWQKDVVAQALQSRWLMNGLLALSASHLAALSDNETTIRTHQERSAQFYQDFLLKWGTKTGGNCVVGVEETKIGAQIFCIQRCSQHLLPSSSPLQWQSFISTIQGCSDPELALHLVSINDNISEGTFIRSTNYPRETSHSGDVNNKCPPTLLQQLHTLPYRMAEVLPKPNSAQDFLATLSAIEALVDCFSVSYASEDMEAVWKGMILWLGRISGHFKALLWCKNEAALVVLCYWFLLVERADRSCWFLKGMGRELREQILEELGGDSGVKALVKNLEG